MCPCRQNLYVKKNCLRRNNNAYIENMAMSSKRKQLMRVKNNFVPGKRSECNGICSVGGWQESTHVQRNDENGGLEKFNFLSLAIF